MISLIYSLNCDPRHAFLYLIMCSWFIFFILMIWLSFLRYTEATRFCQVWLCYSLVFLMWIWYDLVKFRFLWFLFELWSLIYISFSVLTNLCSWFIFLYPSNLIILSLLYGSHPFLSSLAMVFWCELDMIWFLCFTHWTVILDMHFFILFQK